VSDKILLTDRDVEAIYGIPRSTQAKGRMAGGAFCPHIKRGRSVFYLKSDFDAWISGLRRRSTSDQGLAASAQ
jgi:predicted DNA-binding transcriptional regulator AlpA